MDIQKNTRFDQLIVLEKVPAGFHQRQACFLCKCDCGNYKIITGGALRTRRTTSCGCKGYRRDTIMGQARLKSPEELAWSYRYCDYRNKAKRKSRIFDISIDEFKSICSKVCYYCGSPPNFSRPQASILSGIFTNGIDRVDSSKGYSMDNIVPCCSNCNRAKLAMSETEFIELCHRVASRHPHRKDKQS